MEKSASFLIALISVIPVLVGMTGTYPGSRTKKNDVVRYEVPMPMRTGKYQAERLNMKTQAGHIMSYVHLKHIKNVARLGLCY